jgi:hypothetical protein
MPQARLWTPIANSFEAYRRRVVIEPGAEYEHIWRLIHIQEALAVTLASLMAARISAVMSSTPHHPEMAALRQGLTGLRQEATGVDDDDDVEPSPWGGSIGAWIELIRRFGTNPPEGEDPFLVPLAAYLTSKPNRPLAFADAWAKIAPVPSTFRSATLDRVGRLGAINSFRNKLAHVPVPQRLLAELHRGLRVEVLDGLTDKFNPESDANSPGFLATSYREPLVGILYCGSTYVTGSNDVGVDSSRTAASAATTARYGKNTQQVEWTVEPFFRIDGEAKAALLFRVTDLQREPDAAGYVGEYHRFAAELEPVTYATISSESLSPWLPASSNEIPTLAESTASSQDAVVEVAGQALTTDLGVPQVEATQSTEPAGVPSSLDSLNALQLRQHAESSFVQRDYPTARKYFERLAALGDPVHYNDVARSKHGAALWRAAERSESGVALADLLQSAVDLLLVAERHRDPKYSARAAYEGSKALWHLWRATGEAKHVVDALKAAERAVGRSPSEAFISWQARVQADATSAVPQGIGDTRAEGA